MYANHHVRVLTAVGARLRWGVFHPAMTRNANNIWAYDVLVGKSTYSSRSCYSSSISFVLVSSCMYRHLLEGSRSFMVLVAVSSLHAAHASNVKRHAGYWVYLLTALLPFDGQLSRIYTHIQNYCKYTDKSTC